MLAIRRSCPGTLIGVSTAAWIEGDKRRTLTCIGGWTELPDYASVNLEDLDAPAAMERLRQHGIGIKTGLASIADAKRLVALDGAKRCLRIMIKTSEQDTSEAVAVAGRIRAVLDNAGGRPMLLHGFSTTVWHFVTLAV